LEKVDIGVYFQAQDYRNHSGFIYACEQLNSCALCMQGEHSCLGDINRSTVDLLNAVGNQKADSCWLTHTNQPSQLAGSVSFKSQQACCKVLSHNVTPSFSLKFSLKFFDANLQSRSSWRPHVFPSGFMRSQTTSSTRLCAP